MITESDFKKVLEKAEEEIFELAVEYMTDYSKGDVTPREQFTENILEMLKILIGNPYNKSGSFTKDGAEEALETEARFISQSLQLNIMIFHRLYELEQGATSWDWIERQWAKVWRPQLYNTGKRTLAASISNDIKAGKHKGKVAARPYMELTTDDYADTMAENINDLLLSKLPLRRV